MSKAMILYNHKLSDEKSNGNLQRAVQSAIGVSRNRNWD